MRNYRWKHLEKDKSHNGLINIWLKIETKLKKIFKYLQNNAKSYNWHSIQLTYHILWDECMLLYSRDYLLERMWGTTHTHMLANHTRMFFSVSKTETILQRGRGNLHKKICLWPKITTETRKLVWYSTTSYHVTVWEILKLADIHFLYTYCVYWPWNKWQRHRNS